MLGNSIALVTLAVMLASEGKRSEGLWRAGLFTLAAIITLIALALELIANALPVVGTALSAVFGNPLSWFVLLMGLFFVLRPFWTKAATRSNGPIDLADVAAWGEVAKRIDKIEASRVSTAEVEKLKRSVTLLVERVVSNEERQKSDQATLNNLGGVIEDLREEIRSYDKRLLATDSLRADALRTQFQNIYGALSAIWHRERLQAREGEIEQLAGTLSAPSTNDASYGVEEWREWERQEQDWRDKLDRWCEIAEPYSPTVREAIFNLPSDQYRKGWKIRDDQFPNADAVYTYKTFRIIQRNWEGAKDAVGNRVLRAAYGGEANEMKQGAANALAR